jgi:glutamate--cysteine ligase catalytic subunit
MGYSSPPQVECEERHLERLSDAGVDRTLARHVAHLFVRDPLVIFADRVQLDDRADVDHFENIQSTNWQSVRWKPPHPKKAEQPIEWYIKLFLGVHFADNLA